MGLGRGLAANISSALCVFRWPALPTHPGHFKEIETKLEYVFRNGRVLMKSQLKQTDGRHTLLTFFRLFGGVIFIG